MSRRLADKVLLVTGAGSGIGQTMALHAQQEGALLAVTDVNLEGLKATAFGLADGGDEVLALPADVTRLDEVAALVEQVMGHYGRIDALAHCAGVEYLGPADETDESDWDRVLTVNLKGTFLVNQAVIRQMLRHGHGGVILNVASQFGLVGYPMMSAYSAAKGGVIALTRSLALEYAGHQIRINCICPGPTNTPMMSRMLKEKRGAARDAVFGMRAVPLGRIARTEEIVTMAISLLSDAGQYMTGCAVPIDGGWTAG